VVCQIETHHITVVRMRLILLMVRLRGALSNFELQQRLERLNELRERLLAKAGTSPREVRTLKPRWGEIQKAVIAILTAASEPMRVKDVHAAVEQVLAAPISKDSINSCLSTGVRGDSPRFERTKPGWYQARR